MYADDANIIVTGSDIEDVKTKISALLIKLLDWVKGGGGKIFLESSSVLG